MKTTSILTNIILAALLFLTGREAGRRSIKPQTVVRDSIIERWVPGPTIRDTIREPYPIFVREVSDTIRLYRDIDTAALLADYLRERRYALDFSSDSTGIFHVDATIRENKIAEATAIVQPIILTHEVYRTVVDRKHYVWEIGASVGAFCTGGHSGYWIGTEARRSFGRFNIGALAAWSPSSHEPFVQAQIGVYVLRK